tara:strand:+ start:1473 stop:2342 length:870 start_codon:yes stop_codon:yes gene_type:complete
MYIPKGQISKPKRTSGDKFIKADGSRYIGSYFEDKSGNAFTGTKPSSSSKGLIRINSEQTNVDEFGVSIPKPKFTSEFVLPTDIDHERGFFIRYFLQDKRNKKIIEVNKDKFEYFKNFRYIISCEVKWLLTNPIENINKGPYIFFGSSARNKENILSITKIEGLETMFKNYYEFIREENVEITTNNISNPEFDPVVDKKDRVQENLFTEGGEFMIKGTNIEYIGKYHVHPDKGPMVGAKHSNIPHSLLVKFDSSTVQAENQPVTSSIVPSEVAPTPITTTTIRRGYSGY